VQPFQNRLLRSRSRDPSFKTRWSSAGEPGPSPDCHVAGVEVWYDGRKEPGKRITRVRLDTGKDLEKSRSYTLVVSDFMRPAFGFRHVAGAPKQDLDVIDVEPWSLSGVLRTP